MLKIIIFSIFIVFALYSRSDGQHQPTTTIKVSPNHHHVIRLHAITFDKSKIHYRPDNCQVKADFGRSIHLTFSTAQRSGDLKREAPDRVEIKVYTVERKTVRGGS